MSEHLPDFTRLLVPIQLCLVKGPKATPEEFRAAAESFNTLLTIMYSPEQASSPCLDGVVKFIPIRLESKA